MSHPICIRCGWPILDDQSYVAATNGVRHLECPKPQPVNWIEGVNDSIRRNGLPDVSKAFPLEPVCPDCNQTGVCKWCRYLEEHGP